MWIDGRFAIGKLYMRRAVNALAFTSPPTAFEGEPRKLVVAVDLAGVYQPSASRFQFGAMKAPTRPP
jgi:hypothetical protein